MKIEIVRPSRLAALAFALAPLAACAVDPNDAEDSTKGTERSAEALSVAVPVDAQRWDKCCQDANGDGKFDSCGSPNTVLGKKTCTLGWIKANCGDNRPSGCKAASSSATADDYVAPGVVQGWDKCCQDADGDGDFDSCGSPVTILGKKTCTLGYVKANCGDNSPDGCTAE